MEVGALTDLVDVVLARAWARAGHFHGELHWRCVAGSAVRLAADVDGADAVVGFCFGLVHDTRRVNEDLDPEHGHRAASLVRELEAEGALPLSGDHIDLLATAVALHADGQVSADPTVGVCWDADRLHLPRVGIDPDPSLLSTVAARDPAQSRAAATLRASPDVWAELVARVERAERVRLGA